MSRSQNRSQVPHILLHICLFSMEMGGNQQRRKMVLALGGKLKYKYKLHFHRCCYAIKIQERFKKQKEQKKRNEVKTETL